MFYRRTGNGCVGYVDNAEFSNSVRTYSFCPRVGSITGRYGGKWRKSMLELNMKWFNSKGVSRLLTFAAVCGLLLWQLSADQFLSRVGGAALFVAIFLRTYVHVNKKIKNE